MISPVRTFSASTRTPTLHRGAAHVVHRGAQRHHLADVDRRHEVHRVDARRHHPRRRGAAVAHRGHAARRVDELGDGPAMDVADRIGVVGQHDLAKDRSRLGHGAASIAVGYSHSVQFDCPTPRPSYGRPYRARAHSVYDLRGAIVGLCQGDGERIWSRWATGAATNCWRSTSTARCSRRTAMIVDRARGGACARAARGRDRRHAGHRPPLRHGHVAYCRDWASPSRSSCKRGAQIVEPATGAAAVLQSRCRAPTSPRRWTCWSRSGLQPILYENSVLDQHLFTGPAERTTHPRDAPLRRRAPRSRAPPVLRRLSSARRPAGSRRHRRPSHAHSRSRRR